MVPQCSVPHLFHQFVHETSSKSSVASSRRVKSNDNFSIGSLQSVKSTGDVFEAENDEDNSEVSTKDIDMVLDEINDVTEVTENGEKSL